MHKRILLCLLGILLAGCSDRGREAPKSIPVQTDAGKESGSSPSSGLSAGEKGEETDFPYRRIRIRRRDLKDPDARPEEYDLQDPDQILFLSTKLARKEEEIPVQGENIEQMEERADLVYELSLEDLRGSAKELSLYYGDVADEVYLVRDGEVYEAKEELAFYLQSLFEKSLSSFSIKEDALLLFEEFGWTIYDTIAQKSIEMHDIGAWKGFDPNAFYFAYHNELSRDIGLDMSALPPFSLVEAEIYRLYELLPQEFYPIRRGRGIVIRKDGKIVGAYISAGRHDTFNACSLKGRSFEQITGGDPQEWIAKHLATDERDASLSGYTPEQVLEEYYASLGNKAPEEIAYYFSKAVLLSGLSKNIEDGELYQSERFIPINVLPLPEEIASARLLKAECIGKAQENKRTYEISVEWKNKSGEATEDRLICEMIWESKESGWKIESIGY